MTDKNFWKVIATLALIVALGVAIFKGGTVIREVPTSLAGTTNYDSLTLEDDLVVNKTSTLTGTTTPTQFLFPVGGTFSLAATGTVRTVYTNATGPKVCYKDTFGLHMRGNGGFAPLTVVSVGTSTSAVASTNLIASSTISTSTADQIIDNVTLPAGTGAFVLAHGGVITAITGEITGFYGSTTNLTNWSGEVRGLCSESSI